MDGVLSAVRLDAVSYDEPEVRALVAEVQQEYLRRYGSGDDTVLVAAELTPPAGVFVLARLDGVAVAMGGWRAREGGEVGLGAGDAEIKRMYVVPTVQRRGLARAVLAELERTARTAGRRRMVLETGTEQPEAIALYTSSGYVATEKFGLYRHEESSRSYAKLL